MKLLKDPHFLKISSFLVAQAFFLGAVSLTWAGPTDFLRPKNTEDVREIQTSLDGGVKVEAVKTISYPAVGEDIETVAHLIEIFPNVEKVILIDPAYERSILNTVGPLPSQGRPHTVLLDTYKNVKKLFRLVKEHENGFTVRSRKTGRKIEIILVGKYISQYTPEKPSSSSIHIVKVPDNLSFLSRKAPFYAKMIQDMEIGDYLFIRAAFLREDVLDNPKSGLKRRSNKLFGLQNPKVEKDVMLAGHDLLLGQTDLNFVTERLDDLPKSSRGQSQIFEEAF